MADVKIIDIDNVQWNIKDELARDQITTIKEEFSSFTIYSEQEMNTKQKWIDGKDIYRKVISGVRYGNGDISVQSGIKNIDQVVNLSLLENGIIGAYADYVFVGTNRLTSNLSINKKTGIVAATSRQSDITGTNAIFIIEYTKL